jgi:hypothetical protein
MNEVQPDCLDSFMGLDTQDIVRLVLCLLIEDAMKRHLSSFRQGTGAIERSTTKQGTSRIHGQSNDFSALNNIHRV